jgi:hypothetical protein
VPGIGFETRHALAKDLAGFLGVREDDVLGRLTEGTWRRIALISNRLLDLIDRGATYFGRAQEIRRNPGWAANRPIRPEVKLAKINAKVDGAERELLGALDIDPPKDAQQSRHPLAPRSVAYFIPVLDAEADRLEAEARNRES